MEAEALKEVYTNLCAYDKRNPFCTETCGCERSELTRENCMCDNCFYGRTKMAEQILDLLGIKNA